jgi:hypothetical protein
LRRNRKTSVGESNPGAPAIASSGGPGEVDKPTIDDMLQPDPEPVDEIGPTPGAGQDPLDRRVQHPDSGAPGIRSGGDRIERVADPSLLKSTVRIDSVSRPPASYSWVRVVTAGTPGSKFSVATEPASPQGSAALFSPIGDRSAINGQP